MGVIFQRFAAQKTMNVSNGRLSSGLRINNAKDDAAGQGIATRLISRDYGLRIWRHATHQMLSL